MSIILEVQNKRWDPGVMIVRREGFGEVELEEFHRFLARRYVVDVVLAVKRRYYVSRWAPLSVSWMASKKKRGLSLNVWEATSLLISSLNCWKRSGLV